MIFCKLKYFLLVHLQDLQEPDIDWETAVDYNGNDSETGVVVPEYECPLTEEEMDELQTLIDPTDPNITDEQLYIVAMNILNDCGHKLNHLNSG